MHRQPAACSYQIAYWGRHWARSKTTNSGYMTQPLIGDAFSVKATTDDK